jgi:hypothetical protein
MKKSVRLSVERLEDRLTPSATWGVPWPDPTHLTLSFAPDQTDIGGTPSTLYAVLNKIAPTSVWKQEILRGVQTWAVNADINVSVVSDNGLPFGIAGAVQGDTRFGDIRVGAKPLPAGTIATASPFSWTGTTWSGDIVFNSNASFGVSGQGQYDLFTVAMHEAGHPFGFADTTNNPASVMNYTYTGPRTGLSSQDVINLQSLYGLRPADDSSNSFSTAAPISTTLTSGQADGDIGSLSDADYFKFTIPLLSLPLTNFSVTVQTSHISSLLSNLTVYNGWGQVVGQAAAVDPTNGNITVQVNWALPFSTYYARVGSNTTNVFGIGGYHVSLAFASLTGTLTTILAAPFTFINNLTNNTLATATPLQLHWGNTQDARFQYIYTATLSNQNDVNYYQLRSPANAGATPQVMEAMVWAMDANNPLAARINVFDAFGNPVPVQVLANGGGSYSVQIANDTPNAVYFLRVVPMNPSGPNNTGNYFLGVNFNNQTPVALDSLAASTLTNSNVVSDTFTVGESNLFQFRLSSATVTGNSQETIRMTILNSQGQVVLSLTNADGQPPATASIYLLADTYTITYQAFGSNGGLQSSLNYWLDMQVLSDHQGAYVVNADGGGSSNPPPNTYSASNQNTSPPPSKTYYY